MEDASILARIFHAYAEEDSAAAETTARTLLKDDQLDMALQNIAMSILNKDPEAALRLTGTIVNQERRTSTLAIQYRQLDGEDLPGTLDRLQKLDRNLVEVIFRGDDGFASKSVTAMLAKTDPQKLTALVGTMTVSGNNHLIFERAVSHLIEAGNPEMALDMSPPPE